MSIHRFRDAVVSDAMTSAAKRCQDGVFTALLLRTMPNSCHTGGMLLLLLSPSLAAAERTDIGSDLSVVVGLTSQASTVIGGERVFEAGPQAGVGWHSGTIRLALSGSHSNSAVLPGARGSFSTSTLAGSISPSVRNAAGQPVLYFGGGASLGWYQGQITERHWNGWQMDHNESRVGMAIHGEIAWRALHQERFAVELGYAQRYNFLKDSVIAGQHHILSASLWLSPSLR